MCVVPRLISSVEEFVRLRTSEDKRDYDRSVSDQAPEAVWREIIRLHPEMRFWVAHNKTISQAIIDILAVDPDANVRARIASKRSASAQVLSALASDDDVGVRQEVALNAKTPPETIRLLVNDPDEDVSEFARERLEKLKA